MFKGPSWYWWQNQRFSPLSAISSLSENDGFSICVWRNTNLFFFCEAQNRQGSSVHASAPAAAAAVLWLASCHLQWIIGPRRFGPGRFWWCRPTPQSPVGQLPRWKWARHANYTCILFHNTPVGLICRCWIKLLLRSLWWQVNLLSGVTVMEVIIRSLSGITTSLFEMCESQKLYSVRQTTLYPECKSATLNRSVYKLIMVLASPDPSNV